MEGREEQGLELSTNIRGVSQCLDKASTISSSLKAPTGIYESIKTLTFAN